jgi:hypothetical protein
MAIQWGRASPLYRLCENLVRREVFITFSLNVAWVKLIRLIRMYLNEACSGVLRRIFGPKRVELKWYRWKMVIEEFDL